MDTLKLHNDNVKMVAHRGLSNIELENTCPAFIAAGNRSFWGIETDIHVTADNQYIVFHNHDVPTEDGTVLSLESTDFDTLRDIRLPDWDGSRARRDLYMPSLAEYLAICKKYEKVAVIEFKGRFAPERIYEVTEIIQSFDWLEHTVFIAFHMENLDDIRKLYPEQTVQLLTCECNDDLIELLAEKRMDLDVLYSALDAEKVAKLHARGIKVNCWTCNSLEDAERLAEMGVDFITSNIIE